MLLQPKPMNPRVRRLWRFLCLCFLVSAAEWRILAVSNPVEVDQMGILDRLLGRTKKAAGDVMGDSSMRHEGAAQEREAAAQKRAEQHEQMAQEQRDQAAEAHAERDST
jgi:uncharacterized protein YjbJ (UPF0337 family)